MSPLRDPSRHHPSTVSNSLRILEAVACLGLGVTAKEIAAALHMPAATAYRLLNALVAEEYLVRTSDLRGFGLGARLDGLISAAAQPRVPFAAPGAGGVFFCSWGAGGLAPTPPPRPSCSLSPCDPAVNRITNRTCTSCIPSVHNRSRPGTGPKRW
ncbi:helix-turn-helix domain-containing protein [Nocardia farcinica]|uniref:helix-turn-helix domain-containing protein n=1 Tax=Nocardia farcinica TaxID=37329 RepID=UPI003CC7E622